MLKVLMFLVYMHLGEPKVEFKYFETMDACYAYAIERVTEQENTWKGFQGLSGACVEVTANDQRAPL